MTPGLLGKMLELLEEGVSSANDANALSCTASTSRWKREEKELRKAIKDLRERFDLLQATSSRTLEVSALQPAQSSDAAFLANILSDSHSFFNRAMDQGDFKMARLVIYSDTFALPRYRVVCWCSLLARQARYFVLIESSQTPTHPSG